MPRLATSARTIRVVRVLALALVLLGGLVTGAQAHSGARRTPHPRLALADPARNLTVTIPGSCDSAGTSPGCETLGVAALDRARRGEGLGPYRLPRDFTGLSGPEQMFVLTDLDRAARGLRIVPGTTNALDATAMLGIRRSADPVPASMSGLSAFTANWAAGYPDAVWAYLAWMYDDGPGSSNVDCTHAGDAGCWGHRHDILYAFGPTGTLAMGTAEASGADTMIIVQSQAGGTPDPFSFTLATARSQGTGLPTPSV